MRRGRGDVDWLVIAVDGTDSGVLQLGDLEGFNDGGLRGRVGWCGGGSR